MSCREGFGSLQGWGCLLASMAVLQPSSQRMFLLQSSFIKRLFQNLLENLISSPDLFLGSLCALLLVNSSSLCHQHVHAACFPRHLYCLYLSWLKEQVLSPVRLPAALLHLSSSFIHPSGNSSEVWMPCFPLVRFP